MENKSHALAAGTFVLVIAAMLIGLAVWLTRDVTDSVSYEMVTDQVVTGLQPQAMVRFKGVDIGKVTDVSFDPAQHGYVRVRLAVAPDAPITRSTFATLALQGVTGLSYVQLDDPGGTTEPLAPSADGRPPRIPLRGGQLEQFTDQARDMMNRLSQTANSLNQLLRPENQTALVEALKNIGDAAREASHAAKALSALAVTTDKTIQAQFGSRGANFPALVRQADATLKSLQGVSDHANQTLHTVDAAAVDVRRGVERLANSATAISTTTLPHIQGLTDEASHAIRRLDRLVGAIGENPQLLLYGRGAIAPGPGENGFVPPPVTVSLPQTTSR